MAQVVTQHHPCNATDTHHSPLYITLSDEVFVVFAGWSAIVGVVDIRYFRA